MKENNFDNNEERIDPRGFHDDTNIKTSRILDELEIDQVPELNPDADDLNGDFTRNMMDRFVHNRENQNQQPQNDNGFEEPQNPFEGGEVNPYGDGAFDDDDGFENLNINQEMGIVDPQNAGQGMQDNNQNANQIFQQNFQQDINPNMQPGMNQPNMQPGMNQPNMQPGMNPNMQQFQQGMNQQNMQQGMNQQNQGQNNGDNQNLEEEPFVLPIPDPNDPENDGSDFTPEHNKKAHEMLKKYISRSYQSMKALDTASPQNYLATQNEARENINRLVDIVNCNPALLSHFEDNWGEKLKDDFNSGRKPQVKTFLQNTAQQFGMTQEELEREWAPRRRAPENNPNNPENNPNNPENNPNNNPNNPEGNADENDPLAQQIAALRDEQKRIQDEIAALETQQRKNEEQKEGEEKAKDLEDKPKWSSGIYGMFADDKVKERQIYRAEKNGYATYDEIPDDMMERHSEQINDMKHLARELGKMGKFRSKSKQYKQLLNDLTQLDHFMREIGGRTRLTADEMEVYDALSLKAYNSAKSYDEYKNAQIKKRDKVKDPVTNEMTDDINEKDRVKLDAVSEIADNIEKLRSEVFKKEIEKKTEAMQKECDKKIAELDAKRTALNEVPIVPGEENAATREALEKNIAETLFYSNRMQDLGRQGKLSMTPGKSLNQTRANLDKELHPKYSDLENIKKTPLFKDVVDQAMAKIEKGETLTSEEIAGIQKAYVKNQGDKKRTANMKNENTRNIEDHRKGPDAPGLGGPGM